MGNEAVSAAVVAAIKAKYPKKADEVDKGVTKHGAPIVQRGRDKDGNEVVVSSHQKYRLADNTIVTLDA